jgi:predicted metal-dependent hydrolase
MANYIDTSHVVEGVEIPLRIHTERRRNVRIATGKGRVNLRLPSFLAKKEIEKYLTWAKDWMEKQYKEDEAFQSMYTPKIYASGDIFEMRGESFTLSIVEEDRQSHTAKIKGQVIEIKLSMHDSVQHTQKAIKHLLSRVLSNRYLPEITKRVHELNKKFFGKEIKNVKLKYTTSNWGSCSSTGNINLSSRLLFSPQEVIDYVIIHELAHTYEMNHSSRFWDLVRKAMPDYKEKEKWLKVNRAQCEF